MTHTTIDGYSREDALDGFREGAQKLLAQLRAWKINSEDAYKQERNARAMWYEDAERLGISRREARVIWEREIIELILSDDPAFMDY